MQGPIRRRTRLLAVMVLGSGLLGGCSRFEAERAELRHDHVVLSAENALMASVPLD